MTVPTLAPFYAKARFVNPDGTLTDAAIRMIQTMRDRNGGALGDNGIDLFAPFIQDVVSEQSIEQPLQGSAVSEQSIIQPQDVPGVAEMVLQAPTADSFYESVVQPISAGALSLKPSDVGLGNVTNDAQTKAAIVPNTAPNAGQILVGNAGNTAYAPVSMSSDATMTSAGALTISAGAVTLAKMANLAASSILGNNTVSPATPLALTAAQVKTLLAIANTDVSGLGTMSTQAASGVAITGGTINGTSVGGTTASSGAFTSLSANGAINFNGVNQGIELGATSGANSPYIDFHSSGNNIDYDVRIQASGGTGSAGNGAINSYATNWQFNHNVGVVGTVSSTGAHTAMSGTAIPAGGTADTGYLFSSVAHFGVFFGSGAPTLSAAKGSLYLRSDGSSTSTRAYINTNGTTGWTNFTTAT